MLLHSGEIGSRRLNHL